MKENRILDQLSKRLSEILRGKSKKQSKAHKITVSLGLSSCKDCPELNKAIEIMNIFDWRNGFKAIGYDRAKEEILLDEQQIMRIIQMVNPAQQPRKIRLVNSLYKRGSEDARNRTL